MPNKKLNANQKREILKLLADGMKPPQVASKYGVTVRTIQRLLSDTNSIPDGAVTNYDKPNVAIFQYDPLTSEKVYLRLMGLNSSLLDVTEQILLDPNAKNADRLKAASLMARWSGLEPRENKSLNERLAVIEKEEKKKENDRKYTQVMQEHYRKLKEDPDYRAEYEARQLRRRKTENQDDDDAT